MAFHVKFTAGAEKDLEYIYNWVVAQAPLRGPKWFNGLDVAIESLQSNPHRCPMAPESYQTEDKIRNLFYGKKPSVYRILYQVNEQQKTVYILHIRHGARKPAQPEEWWH